MSNIQPQMSKNVGLYELDKTKGRSNFGQSFLANGGANSDGSKSL